MNARTVFFLFVLALVACESHPPDQEKAAPAAAPPTRQRDLQPVSDYLQHVRYVEVVAGIMAEKDQLVLHNIRLGGEVPSESERTKDLDLRASLLDRGHALFQESLAQVDDLPSVHQGLADVRTIERQLVDASAPGMQSEAQWRERWAQITAESSKATAALRTQLDLAGLTLPAPTSKAE